MEDLVKESSFPTGNLVTKVPALSCYLACEGSVPCQVKSSVSGVAVIGGLYSTAGAATRHQCSVSARFPHGQ